MGLGEYLVLGITLILLAAMLRVVSSGYAASKENADKQLAQKEESKEDLGKTG